MEIFLPTDKLVVSKTDQHGKITYANELFCDISGYTKKELKAKPHNIVRHTTMPRSIFQLLWDTVSSGKEINAYVINKTKANDHYWVFANVTPTFDKSGKIIGYYSVRRKPSQSAIKKILPIYASILQSENIGGISHGMTTLNEALKNYGGEYEKFILSL